MAHNKTEAHAKRYTKALNEAMIACSYGNEITDISLTLHGLADQADRLERDLVRASEGLAKAFGRYADAIRAGGWELDPTGNSDVRLMPTMAQEFKSTVTILQTMIRITLGVPAYKKFLSCLEIVRNEGAAQ